MTAADYRHAISPHQLAELVAVADAIQGAAMQLARDPHPDRADQLIERLRAAQHTVQRLRVAMVEAQP